MNHYVVQDKLKYLLMYHNKDNAMNIMIELSNMNNK